MILNQEVDKVESTLEKKTSTFSIAKNPKKLVDVVIKSLYSNPTLASLVELGQNSYDEHIRCGKESVPFEVVLPTYFEPTFRVRDFGNGIPHDYMMNGYTKIFQSTKDEDEDLSGGYGIGRCVVLSLSSTYNVETFIKGKKRSYSVFHSENGIELVYLGIEETKEADGTAIYAPVSQNYIEEFKDAARRAFRYYKTQPIIKGVKDFQIGKPKYALEGTGWAIEENDTGNHAICGIYHYEINVKDLIVPNELDGLMRNFGVVLRFGPSDLDVQANRQGLHYSEKTRAKIIERLKVIKDECGKLISAKFTNCKNYFEAKLLYNKIMKDNAFYKLAQISRSLDNVQWNGLKIDGSAIKIEPTKNTYFYWRYNRRKWSNVVKHDYNVGNLECSEKTILCLDDIKNDKVSKIIRRCKNFLEQEKKTSSIEKSIHVFSFADNTERDAFFARTNLELGNFILLSSMPSPPLLPRSYNAERAKAKVFSYNRGTDTRKPSENWDVEDEIDLDKDGGIYVIIDKYHVENYSIDNFNATVEKLEAVSGMKFDIIGIRQTAEEEIKSINNNPKWIPFETLRESVIKNYVVPQEEEQILADSIEWNDIINSSNYSNSVRKILGYEGEKTDFESETISNLVEKAAFFRKQDKKHQKIREKHKDFISLGGQIAPAKAKPSFKLKEFINAYQRFPIVNHVEFGWYSVLPALKVLDKTLAVLEKHEKKA